MKNINIKKSIFTIFLSLMIGCFFLTLTIGMSRKNIKKNELEIKLIQFEEHNLCSSQREIIVNNLVYNPIKDSIKDMQKEMQQIEHIKDKKEWFIEYKKIISKYSNTIDPPETIYDYYTIDELNFIFRVVQAEIGDEYSFIEKCNVASVIFNRIENKEFGNNVNEILTSDQFSTIKNKKYLNVEISEDTILACEYAFMIEDTTDGCLYFESGNNKIHAAYAKEVFTDKAGHTFYKEKDNLKNE